VKININYNDIESDEARALSLMEEIASGSVITEPSSSISSSDSNSETGAFEVYVNEELIFSKLDLDRFPNDGEIVQLIGEI
tara:strand:- start:1006 stop:1248 length:243 start_codon:yes stop_codon:yes gene_type:complete